MVLFCFLCLVPPVVLSLSFLVTCNDTQQLLLFFVLFFSFSLGVCTCRSVCPMVCTEMVTRRSEHNFVETVLFPQYHNFQESNPDYPECSRHPNPLSHLAGSCNLFSDLYTGVYSGVSKDKGLTLISLVPRRPC